jgi:hypothetical protein
MKKYCCRILYKCDEVKKVHKLLKTALNVLGFEPARTDVFFDEFSKKSVSDLKYDEDYLFDLLNEEPGTLTLKNMLYNEGEREAYSFFSLEIHSNDKFEIQACSLSWVNSNLEFLLKNDEFQHLLNFENLVYCYCHDQYDISAQTDKSRVNPDFNNPWQEGETSRPYILHDEDISRNWGRSERVGYTVFVAAPLMWFGIDFYKLIRREKLLAFPFASDFNAGANELVMIKLFDLYDDPAKMENRRRQMEFWSFFELQSVIDKFKEENKIKNYALWLQNRAIYAKQRKRKK